jgi:cytidylate kinase
MDPLIVAIDGPTGVGKSTVARRLAERLGVPYLDTGAMYRALGLKVLEAGLDPADRQAVAQLLPKTEIFLERAGGDLRVLLDGRSVEERIRTPRVGAAASAVAVHPEVRRHLVRLQQEGARRTGGVLEGRDIGTKVFPSTPHKFFLDADPRVRFERRYEELRQRGEAVTLEGVAEAMRERDERDTGRTDSPLQRDSTYRSVDASHKSADEVVEEVLTAVRGTGGDAGR